jgi:hypothetical protein
MLVDRASQTLQNDDDASHIEETLSRSSSCY